jgi:tetratricopeptide (TPR) repeat protein
MNRALPILALTLVLAACRMPEPYEPPSRPQPVPPKTVPRTEPPAPTPPEPVPPPPPAPPPATKSYQLGAASAALVAQAQSQANGGNSAAAVATLERALRIEPANPLLWIELGKVHQTEGRYAQSNSMGRKALQLATGDPRTQSSAWRLIAESLRAQNRNAEAAEALKKAEALTIR